MEISILSHRAIHYFMIQYSHRRIHFQPEYQGKRLKAHGPCQMASYFEQWQLGSFVTRLSGG